MDTPGILLFLALSLGVLGGTGASFVVLLWLRRRGDDDTDLNDLATEVASQGKALRKLTMRAVRANSAVEPVNEPDPNSPEYKAMLRGRVFGRARH